MRLIKSCEKATFLVEFRYQMKSHAKLHLTGNDASGLSDYTRVKASVANSEESVDFSALHNFVEAAEVNNGSIVKVSERNSFVYFTASFENCSNLSSFIEVLNKEVSVVIKHVWVEYINPLKYSGFKVKSPSFYVKVFERELRHSKKASHRRIYWLQRTVKFFKIADEFNGEVVSKNGEKVLVDFKDLSSVVKFNTKYYEGF